jgi:hypothetical protein
MTGLAAAAVASTSAEARHRLYYACAVTNSVARLKPPGCHRHYCSQRIIRGRAFRVLGQDRHHGRWLWVWNLETEGRIDFRALQFAHEALCRAAGI